MDRLDPEKLTPCLALIGMITWVIRTPWVDLADLLIPSEVEETLFCLISSITALSLGPSSIFLEV
jgi:hypothetical protein